MKTRERPAGPPAATVRPGSGGVGRGTTAAAEAVSDALRRGDSRYLDGRRRAAVLQMGAASAGVSLVLAGMGGAKRHEEQPWIPLVLLAKSLVDAAGGTYLFAEQVTKHKKVCSWCTASAALLVATVPAVLPEARAAWRAWRDR